MFTWKAIIRTPYGDTEVTIQAQNQHIARQLLEAKYGRENILGNEVRET